MSPLLLSRSSIISTSTSMTSTARMRTMKVLPRYQVSVFEGKKSNSTDGGLLARALVDRPRPVAPAQQLGHPLGQLGPGRLERPDRLPAGDERNAEVHPADQRGEQRERPPQRKQRIDPAELGDRLP